MLNNFFNCEFCPIWEQLLPEVRLLLLPKKQAFWNVGALGFYRIKTPLAASIVKDWMLANLLLGVLQGFATEITLNLTLVDRVQTYESKSKPDGYPNWRVTFARIPT